MGKKKSSIGCLFWIALVLLVLVVFLFNRKTIESVLERTGLLNYVTRERPAAEAPEVRHVEPEKKQEPSPPVAAPVRDTTPTRPQEPQPRETKPDEKPAVVVTKPPTPAPVPSPAPSASPQPEPSVKLRQSKLYFISVDEKGEISLRTVMRPVSYVDSPLTDTLASLLKGLMPAEISDGMLSLVPEGTRLLGVTVRNGTAFVNFNEAFRFNAFGREGYRSQLKQIVFTATEFQTVQNVQVLVNGEKVSFLGPESPFVGNPLSRESL